MLPIKLIIEGLYSYQSRQLIDFDNLTNSGLFGIFGGVGSGKSSILEAISIVLYGETERLNSKDRRGYNMLNLKSDKAYIEFEFTNFEEKKFKFTASWNRKKKFEETTTINRLAYEWIEDNWIPIASANATDIIGLTYENFRRTIIIPQGKFKEFIELKGADRSKMMKEIFNLERFDLSNQVSALQKINNSKMDTLKGALSGFEAISPEIVKQYEEEFKVANLQLESYKKQYGILEKECNTLREAKIKMEELQKIQSDYDLLLRQKPEMIQLKADINQFETVQKAFDKLINKESENKNALKQEQVNRSNIVSDKDNLTNQIKVQENTIEELQSDYNQLDSNKQKVLDLQYLSALCNLQKSLEEKNISLAKGNDYIKEVKEKELNIQQKIKEREIEVDTLKTKIIDTSKWLEIGNWYHHQGTLSSQQSVLDKKKNTTLDKIKNAIAEFSSFDLDIETWEGILDKQKETIELKIVKLSDQITALNVATELSKFSDNLHDGEACPLCGSLEHPEIRHIEDVSEELQLAKNSKLKLEIEDKVLQSKITLLKEKTANYNFLKNQERELIAEQKALDAEKEQHLIKFIWNEFDSADPTAFEAKKASAKELETKIKEEEDYIKSIRLEFEKLQQTNQKALEKINLIKSEIAGLEGQINQLNTQIKLLVKSDYLNISKEDIDLQSKNLERENLRIESLYKQANDILQDIRPKLAAKNGILETLNKQIELIEKNIQEVQIEIAEALTLNKLNNIDDVHQILYREWNLDSEKERLQQFEIKLQSTEQQLESLKKQTATFDYNADVHIAKEEEYIKLKNLMEEWIGKSSSLQQELNRIKSELDRKNSLIEELAQLEKRSLNLATMNSLFKASGFVNFVSSIYLQNLCDVANVRFHRLTRNQLSLKLNDSNEFEVIDYLNKGYSRSVKTLSGGQGFQASLCLALALAESVQTLNKSDKNFFFIDEGFGTQDADSINTVFETLQYLHKENRVVGIISHMEELKERIPSSISIVKDEDKGSLVVL